jgi:hypothetical protein
MKRKVSEDFLNEKREMRMQSIAKLFIIIFALAIVLTITLSYMVVTIIKLHTVAKNRIIYIAFNEIGNETNRTLLINKILKWEKENIVDLNEKKNENYPCIRIPDGLNLLLQDYSLISLTRCGKCGEFAEMFSELADVFNIKNRIIYADNIYGGNHAWVEIIDGNETIPIDTTSVDGYNASQFYDCKFLIQYRNIQVRSFFIGEDVSKKYYSWCS